MLLQFELDGQSCAAGSYTFRLERAINFTRLALRSVSVQCGNDKLAQSWSYTTTNVAYDGSAASRQLTAPLYIDMSSFLSAEQRRGALPADRAPTWLGPHACDGRGCHRYLPCDAGRRDQRGAGEIPEI